MVVKVIGAGLAGIECAYQLAKRNLKVKLYDTKPNKKSLAHKSEMLGELVCSNSLKSKELTNSCGLLKKEMELLDSTFIKSALASEIPSGSALGVDREKFAEFMTKIVKENPNIEFISEEIITINPDEPTVIATGPLTSSALYNHLKDLLGFDYLHFYDAAAPVIEFSSVDMNIAFFADRFNKGDADYINCGMNKEEYYNFVNELVNAKVAELKDFEKSEIFEGCMPIEIMAKRGIDSLRFGPLKPIGIINPNNNEKYYAVVQLRKENAEGTLYNLVGFQTNLTFGEQKRVLSMIPGLKNIEIVRYGVMHRNAFINAPKIINKFYQVKSMPNLFIAGQLSGVEGYVESASSGLMCGINMAKYLNNEEMISFSSNTAIGSLINYISSYVNNDFQPMNSNYGIMNKIDNKDKNAKRLLIAERALKEIKENINKV